MSSYHPQVYAVLLVAELDEELREAERVYLAVSGRVVVGIVEGTSGVVVDRSGRP